MMPPIRLSLSVVIYFFLKVLLLYTYICISINKRNVVIGTLSSAESKYKYSFFHFYDYAPLSLSPFFDGKFEKSTTYKQEKKNSKYLLCRFIKIKVHTESQKDPEHNLIS